MADTDETKQQSPEEEKKSQKSEKKSLIGRLLPIVIILVVVGFCAGVGFGLGRFIAGPSQSNTTESNEAEAPDKTNDTQQEGGSENSSGEVWYYDFDPVVANLNEPSVARYVSLSITLQISSELAEKDGKTLIDQKKPILTDWLTVYLAGLGIEDIRGDKNLKSIQSHILNAFNEKLFPDSKPKIKHILFKNVAVQ